MEIDALDDSAIVGGIASLNGKSVTVIGHQKGRDTKENIYRNFVVCQVLKGIEKLLDS